MNLCYSIDPPAITSIEVTEVCANDFTVSWTAASNEGLYYGAIVSPLNISVAPILETSYNFTVPMPATSYVVSIFSIIDYSTCVGIPNNTIITTLAVEDGVPQSELSVVSMYLQ